MNGADVLTDVMDTGKTELSGLLSLARLLELGVIWYVVVIDSIKFIWFTYLFSATDIQQVSSNAVYVTPPSSGKRADSSTDISENNEATTSGVPLGFSLDEPEGIGKQFVDHLAKFAPLQQDSHKGQSCAGVASVLEKGKIVM